ncbi:hypothetical protein FA95DRAFT_1567215 [Auriscalpium vulgare]|uniref:Uncharacterized protein n=1 Tax=Auriscalpium vulgare TaxID=40419 RepID=A0ACB8R5K4_9AGAM|nr:hypothetical protein FA95DRAFT_1567215 [Auriscalpium vulgare]
MRFRLATLSFLVLASALVGGVLARQSPRQACGAGEVLSKSTLFHDGKEIQVVTKTCPSLNATAPVKIEKRQYAQCTDGCAKILCEDYGNQPFVSDCQVITNALEAQYPAEFSVPAGTYAEWSYYSCAYAFINFDSIPYNVCYINFGYNAIIVADDCFGDWPAPSATPGAACASPGTPGNDWGIEVFFP